jgi:hypothetical protein
VISQGRQLKHGNGPVRLPQSKISNKGLLKNLHLVWRLYVLGLAQMWLRTFLLKNLMWLRLMQHSKGMHLCQADTNKVKHFKSHASGQPLSQMGFDKSTWHLTGSPLAKFHQLDCARGLKAWSCRVGCVQLCESEHAELVSAHVRMHTSRAVVSGVQLLKFIARSRRFRRASRQRLPQAALGFQQQVSCHMPQ